jgi:hypothetical protein
VDTHSIRRFIAKPQGTGLWAMFETNSFGYVDREQRVTIVGHLKEPSEVAGLVDLLNAAPELLEEYEGLVMPGGKRGGTGAVTSSRLLVSRVVALREALDLALSHAKDPNDPALVKLRELL